MRDNSNGDSVGLSSSQRLDTGARIDYMDPSLLDTSNAISHERDYNPILGHFEVDGYKTTYGICDQEFETITYGATDMLKDRKSTRLNSSLTS